MKPDFLADLRAMISWMQDYERYGGKMTPPRAFKILTLLETSLDVILNLMSTVDILETERRVRNGQNRV